MAQQRHAWKWATHHASVHPDGHELVVVGPKLTACLDARDGRVLAQFDGRSHQVRHSPSGTWVAIDEGRSVTLREAGSLALVRTFAAESPAPRAITFVGDELLVVAARTVRLFSTTDGSLLSRHDSNDGRYEFFSIRALAWTGDDTLALADDGGSDESELVLHRAGDGKLRLLDHRRGAFVDVPLRVPSGGLCCDRGQLWARTAEGIVQVSAAGEVTSPRALRRRRVRDFDVRGDRIGMVYEQARGISAAIVQHGSKQTISSITPPPIWVRVGEGWFALGGLTYGVRVFEG